MKLVNEIKNAVEMEIRIFSGAQEYFEAVFMAKDLNKLSEILEREFGKPLKPAGKDVRFDEETQKIADLIGGLRREQIFYVKNEGEGRYVYAALWPWQSDLSRITLKIGVYNVSA